MTQPTAWPRIAAALLTLACGAGAQELLLGNLSQQPVLAGPGSIRHLAAADLDGDGRPDVIVTHGDDVAVLLARPDASLAGAWLGVGLNALVRQALPVDWDLDGRLDLAVVRDNRRLNVWTGDGAGGVVTQLIPEATKSLASRLATGDLDGDGLTDLVLAQSGPDELEILLGDGSEDGKASLVTPVTHPLVDVALGDLDGDGDLDVLALDSLRLRWWTSDGEGVLGAVGNLALGGVPTTLATAELDGDAAAECVVLVRPHGGEHVLHVLDSLADGTPVPVQAETLGADFEHVALADLDGDGLHTLHLGADEDNPFVPGAPVERWRPTGLGTLAGPEPLPTAGRISALLVADLQGDGLADLLVGHDPIDDEPDAGERLLTLYRGDGLGGLLTPAVDASTPSPASLGAPFLSDLDVDGLLDVVVPRGPGGMRLYRGQGHLQFAPSTPLSHSVDVAQMAVADLDGDGRPDLALAQTDGSSPGLSVFLGDGTLDPPLSWHVPAPYGSLQVLVQDMGADGDLDLLERRRFVPFSISDLRVIAQQTDGSFLPLGQTALFDENVRLLGGDLDGDGAPDVLSIEFDGDLLCLRGSVGSDTLGHGPLGHVGVDDVSDGRLADLDGDGDLDLLVPGRAGFGNETWQLNLLANDGSGAFTPAQILPTPQVSRAELGDLDGDGAVEIVTSRDGLLVVRSGSLGAPWSEQRYAGELTRLADVDGDGRLEVLATGSQLVITPHGLSTWTDVDGGVAGGPRLVASGDLQPRGALSLRFTGAAPHGVVWAVVGAGPLGAPKAGGLLVPRPDVVLPLQVDGSGALTLPLVLPAVALAGVPLWIQPWTADGGLLPGDGLLGVTP